MVGCNSSGKSTQTKEPAVHSQPEGKTEQRAVLITGASSGIGRKTAELLASKGFFVYAGARKDKDLKELSAIDNVQGIRLDVTVPAEIEAAVETVRKAGRGLYGLINNAGVTVISPLIEVPEDELHFQMNVNVYGPYRVTKAFAPLILESKGRIAITGSVSGITSWVLGGPYAMSKHAIEAFADVLALEMEPFGVQVSLIEPGNYSTRLNTRMRKRMEASGIKLESSLYKEQIEDLLDLSESKLVNTLYLDEPDDVAEAFLQALSDEHPKRRYLVVPYQHEAELTIQSAITRLVQLNEDHPYSYNREELIEMLDQSLSRAHP
jgi:NAD(P)-dependent dehydrogenase (short-subunit alcohol dehydrogenase family)